MSDLTKFARPYARAAFEIARDQAELAKWSGMLGSAAALIVEPSIEDLTRNPSLAQKELARMITETGGEHYNEAFGRLLEALAENRRLAILPEIAEQYEAYRLEEEKRLAVRVVSAIALDDDQAERLAAALQARFSREITLNNEVNSDLIGGAIIYAGDTVIDGSVRGQLTKLANTLSI